MQKSFWLFGKKNLTDGGGVGGLAIPQVFSYPDNKSKLSDELSENAHQQVSPTNPSLWAWNDNRFQVLSDLSHHCFKLGPSGLRTYFQGISNYNKLAELWEGVKKQEIKSLGSLNSEGGQNKLPEKKI